MDVLKLRKAADKMAQGRILNKSISTDPEFNGMSSQAQLLYLKTIPHLDRDGLITGHPSRLWATIDPFHAELLSRMGEYVQEWVNAGLVIRYDTGSEQVLFFKGFRKNNPNFRYEKEAPSHFPPPPGWLRTRVGLIPENEDLRYHLAQKFNPKSEYRELLLEQSPSSPPDPDEDATPSRPGHDEDATLSRGIQYKQNMLLMLYKQTRHRNLVIVTGGVQGGMIHPMAMRMRSMKRTRKLCPTIWRNLATPPYKPRRCNWAAWSLAATIGSAMKASC